MTKGFAEAIGALVEMRRHEGAALGRVLSTRLNEIAALAARAEQRRAASRRRSARGSPSRWRRCWHVGALRSRPAAPGSDPARHQGRHARGARSARRACRAGEEPDRAGRRGRPPARFSGAGTQPRIEYAHRQGQRCRAHQYRPGTQGVVEQFREQVQNLEWPWRARLENKKHRPPRPDAGAVVAVGRRQDDVVAHAAQGRWQHRAVGLGDDAPAAPRRKRRPGLSFHRPRPLRRHGGEAASCWNGPKCSATTMVRRAGPVERAYAPAATCCSTSIGRARNSCAKKRATILSASSCCRRRFPSSNASAHPRADDKT